MEEIPVIKTVTIVQYLLNPLCRDISRPFIRTAAYKDKVAFPRFTFSSFSSRRKGGRRSLHLIKQYAQECSHSPFIGLYVCETKAYMFPILLFSAIILFFKLVIFFSFSISVPHTFTPEYIIGVSVFDYFRYIKTGNKFLYECLCLTRLNPGLA